MTKIQWRLIAIIAVLLVSVYLIYPTYEWYSMPQAERDTLESLKDPIMKKILNLGLDLKGGVYFMLEVDMEGLEGKTDLSEAIIRAKEVIRNRVDQFGVAEPRITDQGKKWIIVQLPGMKDIELAKELVGKTALLEFKLVDDSDVLMRVQDKLAEMEKGLSDYRDKATGEVLTEIAEIIPEGREIVPGKKGNYFLVHSDAELTGARLVDAKVQLGGNTGFPHVSLKFDSEGAKLFSKTTGNNIDRNLAIVLDGVVQSAPVIRSRIPNGEAIIEGSFNMEEAKFLATVLRAGALPAPLNIIEERTVGPLLGEDSIKAGFKAVMLGLLLIVVFMAIYYKMAGIITDMALVFNFLIILGVMAYFHATLTLPGIAGLILSLGMAVDANVLIFERIREELRLGKTVRLAIDMGYQKALSAIVDGNITTLIAAFFLYNFGTGPVKGFALTLMIGLAASMFTALIATRTVFDYALAGRPVQKLSI